jgi:hypothetical protein
MNVIENTSTNTLFKSGKQIRSGEGSPEPRSRGSQKNLETGGRGSAEGNRTDKAVPSASAQKSQPQQDIFALHKDLLDAIKNRPDDNLSVPIELQ